MEISGRGGGCSANRYLLNHCLKSAPTYLDFFGQSVGISEAEVAKVESQLFVRDVTQEVVVGDHLVLPAQAFVFWVIAKLFAHLRAFVCQQLLA